MNILIVTQPDDMHAMLVKLALDSMNHQVSLLFSADQPTKLKHSIRLDKHTFYSKSVDLEGTATHGAYDVVWWRRPRRPYIPDGMVHPEDVSFVELENQCFFDSFIDTLSPNARWINEKEGAARANHKIFQLKIAQACGMSIPVTLCSNDPKEIRKFLFSYEQAGIIYKSFSPAYWAEKETVRILYTSRVNLLDLPVDELLQASPGIFQKEVKKSFELRIVAFGKSMIAAKINSQALPMGALDWRASSLDELKVEPFDLPAGIQVKIRSFMDQLGIVFGVFDFIVTPEGEYVFLEVNEQGQFLWIEELNPEFVLFDQFIHFLVHGDQKECMDFAGHKMLDYREDVERLLNHQRQCHVDLNRISMHSS